MSNKMKYAEWCKNTYVPIFSKPYWMDAVCGSENWDVWLYESGGQIMAAMPYYKEKRGEYSYITKAPLTQNNGILFKKDECRKEVTFAELQEKIINSACEFIKELKLDVYEQQFHHSFMNWSPFYWHNYTCILRYTYIIQDTSDLEKIQDRFTSNYRKNIRKGERMTTVCDDISPEVFYKEHEKVFSKQGLPVPISMELWKRLYNAVQGENAGKMICARDGEGNIHSLLYIIWDEKAAYLILGGYMPEFASSQSYSMLIYHSIKMAHEKGVAYDFEGSMMKNIASSYRQFGGTPTPYYRIRKVFNPLIVRKETEDYIEKIIRE